MTVNGLKAVLRRAIFAVTAINMALPAAFGEIRVYPRLITPGSSAENNRVLFEYDYADEPRPTLKIYDIQGHKVKDVSTMNPRGIATGWQVAWDGRDDNGRMVMPGVYIYQWTEGTSVIKGAVVVAR